MIEKQNLKILLEQLYDIIDLSLNESLEINSVQLEKKIIECIKENCPTTIIVSDTFKDIIDKWFKIDTKKYKESLEFKRRDMLYQLASKDSKNEDIENDKTFLYNSYNTIVLGSNFSYFDYKKNCLAEIMKIIQDSNLNSISYAKRSMQLRDLIDKIIYDYYLMIMSYYGNELINKSDKLLQIDSKQIMF